MFIIQTKYKTIFFYGLYIQHRQRNAGSTSLAGGVHKPFLSQGLLGLRWAWGALQIRSFVPFRVTFDLYGAVCYDRSLLLEPLETGFATRVDKRGPRTIP